jgi:hypothetical protein
LSDGCGCIRDYVTCSTTLERNVWEPMAVDNVTGLTAYDMCYQLGCTAEVCLLSSLIWRVLKSCFMPPESGAKPPKPSNFLRFEIGPWSQNPRSPQAFLDLKSDPELDCQNAQDCGLPPERPSDSSDTVRCKTRVIACSEQHLECRSGTGASREPNRMVQIGPISDELV